VKHLGYKIYNHIYKTGIELTELLTRKQKRKGKKVERKLANLTDSSIVVALSEYNILYLHTITNNKGCEFSEHEKLIIHYK